MSDPAAQIRVLLIAPEPELGRIVRLLGEGLDSYAVDRCGDTDRCIFRIALAEHDVVLVDHALARRVGLDLLNLVTFSFPLIVLTDPDTPEREREAEAELGDLEVCARTATGLALRRAIKRAIERTRLEKELRFARNSLEGTAQLAGPLRAPPLAVDRAPSEDTRRSLSASRILVAEPAPKDQTLARMALIGSGVTLDFVATVADGRAMLAANAYTMLLVARPLLELAEVAHTQQPGCRIVLAASDGIDTPLSALEHHPFVGNVFSRSPGDRNLAIRNLLATVAKTCTGDVFGLDKYLSWGVEVKEHPIVASDTRLGLLDQMDGYFASAGIRRGPRHRAFAVGEELLMNAIYDAPTDAAGTPLFAHRERTERIALEGAQQGRFRYACDGLLMAVAAEDPFGSLSRETVLHYVAARERGEVERLMPDKGGGGWGMFQIMRQSSLLVINLEPGRRTEVIAIQGADVQSPGPCALAFFTP